MLGKIKLLAQPYEARLDETLHTVFSNVTDDDDDIEEKAEKLLRDVIHARPGEPLVQVVDYDDGTGWQGEIYKIPIYIGKAIEDPNDPQDPDWLLGLGIYELSPDGGSRAAGVQDASPIGLVMRKAALDELVGTGLFDVVYDYPPE